MASLPSRPRLVGAVLSLAFLASPALAQLDEPAAKKALAAAAKGAGKLYAQEVAESVLFFGLDLGQAIDDILADGYQAEDLDSLVRAYDGVILGLRGDAEEVLDVFAQGASDALAAAAQGPLDGVLPAHFRPGGRKTVDLFVARLERLQSRTFAKLDKVTRKLEKGLAKTVPVTLALRVYPPASMPALAFDETGALATPLSDLTCDLVAVVHEPHLLPARRAAAAGFASPGAGDVTVDRLDLSGAVVDSIDVVPDGEGRWLAVLDLPGPGPVVLRASQGGVGVTRSLAAP